MTTIPPSHNRDNHLVPAYEVRHWMERCQRAEEYIEYMCKRRQRAERHADTMTMAFFLLLTAMLLYWCMR